MSNMLIKTHCKRCGCRLTMLAKSLFGADDLKAELGQICGECLTPEENHRISTEVMELAVQHVCRPTFMLHRRGH